MTVFSQKSKLKFIESNKPKRITKIKDWFSKWDKTIAAITAVIIFCILLILVVVNIIVIDEDKDNKNEETNSSDNLVTNTRLFGISKTVPFCQFQTDSISCESISAENLCTEINKLIQQTQIFSINQLILKDIQYSNNEIEEGWLKCTNLTFEQLTISGSKLWNIQAKGFNGSPFNNLEVLSINSQVLDYKRNMFDGLSGIKRLEITCPSTTTFEENVFGAIAKTLQILQLSSNCIKQTGDVDKLTPILGASENLDGLIELDLRFNTLIKLKKTSFQSVTSLEVLHLSQSGIKEIEEDTFLDLNLKILDLSGNNLQTVPRGIFDDVVQGINILGNKWKCDCDLVWLKNLVLNQPNKFNPPNFFCYTENSESLPYTTVDFCSNDTTEEPTTSETINPTEEPTTSETINPTEEPTTSETINPTEEPTTSETINPTEEPTTSETINPTETTNFPDTTNPTETSTSTESSHDTSTSTTPLPPLPDIILVDCINPTAAEIPETGKKNVLNVRNSSVSLRFYFSVSSWVLKIDGNITDNNLLWFKSNDKSNIWCLQDLRSNNQVEVDFLRIIRNQTYIFCLIHSMVETISPFDCDALHIPPEDEDIFLKGDAMIPLICGICASLLLVSAITGLIVFYCIRQNPSLIKGNKRVIIVESEAADAIVMPPYYDEIHYKPPSMNSYSNGYLTPKHHGYYTPPRTTSRLRTISENTDFSIPSTSSDRTRRNYYKRKTRIEHVGRSYEDHLYEPPPLPPNHPSKKNSNENISINYSRV